MKKIMFNDRYGLTRAVLEGRKTMTRRVIPARIANYIDWKAFSEGVEDCWDADNDNDRWYNPILAATYQPGEIVAVAQSYLSIHEEMMDESFGEGYGDGVYDAFRWAIVDDKTGWRNKMFVKADLMPHQIRITNVRVERLQDITDEDCLREGVIMNGDWSEYNFALRGFSEWFRTPRDALAALIDKVSGKGTWESNLWVFVYEFELVK